MPLIYNRILTHFSGLNSVALNATGDLAAVCFNDRELHVYRIIGGATEIGTRFGVDNYEAKPFYLDDRTVVINTPGGALVGIDTRSGKVERLINGFSPIQDLSVHHQRRLLLVGTKRSAHAPSVVNVLGLHWGANGVPA